ncbi:unnamed protein product [Mytilus coruscus]|uniref:B box-type domain-containing protein n=1 Tax=Mytilus coruscus TaxID=42192 RepID=A0A6J8EC42_MYTCO|nr:unnamed protein product [Mytilus coruscus]
MATSTICKLCGKTSPIFYCKTYKIWCCNVCFKNHTSSCKRLAEFQYHICKRHTRQVQGYCCKCYEITCNECAVLNHKGHSICSIPAGLRNITSENTAAVSKDLLAKEIRLKSFFQKCHANFPEERHCLVTCIKEEEKNGIAGVKDELILHLENIQKFHLSKKALLNEAKVNFDSLQSNNFSLTTLSRWSHVKRLLQKCNERFTNCNTNVVVNLMNVSDIRQLFRSRVM